MGFPNIVCPNHEVLLRKFTGHSVALRVNSCDDIAVGMEKVRQSGNTLFCVMVESDQPLADIDFADHHQDIPLAVMVPAMGRFRDLSRQLDRLRRLNLRVYLACEQTDNLASLRILSSLGIHCCADFRSDRTDWESLTDLATYAILGQAPHAPIEPFAFIVAHYDPSHYLDWGRVTFDDPRHFLHLDEDGRVALSRTELDEKRFVAHSLGEIVGPDDFPPIRQRLLSWRRYFTYNHPCASCAGWKICLGKFSGNLADNAGCSEFFREMMDLIRQARELEVAREERPVWRL